MVAEKCCRDSSFGERQKLHGFSATPDYRRLRKILAAALCFRLESCR